MIMDSHNCAWLMRYPNQPMGGGAMYAVQLPATIPAAGTPGGPPATSETHMMFGGSFPREPRIDVSGTDARSRQTSRLHARDDDAMAGRAGEAQTKEVSESGNRGNRVIENRRTENRQIAIPYLSFSSKVSDLDFRFPDCRFSDSSISLVLPCLRGERSSLVFRSFPQQTPQTSQLLHSLARLLTCSQHRGSSKSLHSRVQMS